ncbi:protein containing Peptidase M23 domain, also conserved in CS-04 [Candidatus Magnetobacterium bavaricum]|uniref:Protein containing Peptidase M23 domain, also conserved in CS-04 n=1 Tax=Candidatus Magnetobacterium bavaricum TaxID=29290 RepID=A0A0F3GLX1_9BACT|nr:protein containing Peptidase M23 domain, also conserved in CS-04 [Candidatus Magnetobacterium bavaricum]
MHQEGGVYAMLRSFYILTVIVTVLLSNSLSYSQQEGNFGFGVYELSRSQPDLTPQQIEELKAEIRQNVVRLKAEGKLPAEKPKAAVLFSLPLKVADTVKDYGFYGIANFVDQDPAYPNHLLDYNCGVRTYDTASGNHQGTDFFTWPLPWKKMDNNEVFVIAGAAGTIVSKEDGNYDKNCTRNAGLRFNGVFIRHSDGSTAWYVHLKNGSLTTKTVGDTVQEGEVLGVVASSGDSDGPHLHFGLYDSDGNLKDPFSGSCNKINAASLWKSQRPYYEPSVLKLTTSAVAYEYVTCQTTDTFTEKTTFHPGDAVWFTTFFRDQTPDLESVWSIYRPDGTLFKSRLQSSPKYYWASYWYWYDTLPTDAPSGKWRFQVVFNGQTYEQDFNVEVNAAVAKKVKNDFDGDGQSDVLWRNAKTGDIYIWLMDGSKITGGSLVIEGVPADWEIKATKDFSGDGKADLLWQNTTTGDVALWLMDGAKIAGSGYVARAVPSNWQIQATADYNGDGKTDILWQDINTGDVYVQFMDGLKISGGDFVTHGLPGDWQTK